MGSERLQEIHVLVVAVKVIRFEMLGVMAPHSTLVFAPQYK